MIINTVKKHSLSGEVLNNKNNNDILTYNTYKLEHERTLMSHEIADQLIAEFKRQRPKTRQKSMDILKCAIVLLLKTTGKVLNVRSVTELSRVSSNNLFKAFRDMYSGFIYYQSGFATNEGARPPIVGMDKPFADILLEQWKIQKGNIDITKFNHLDYVVELENKKDLGDPSWNGEYYESEFE